VVTITRDSDDTNVDAGSTIVIEEKNVFELTGDLIPEVDILNITWKDEEGTHIKQIEVVGDFVCTVQEIEKFLEVEAKNEEEYDQAEIEEQRERATRDIEAACWDAFRHRYCQERLSGENRPALVLRNRHVVKVLAVVVNGVSWDESEIDELVLTSIGLERANTNSWGDPLYPMWPEGRNNIVVSYVYGHENYPSAINPVVELAASYLMPKPNDKYRRATSAFDVTTGTNYKLVTAGEKGARFNVPSVNAFVEANEVLRFV